jgi:type IV pilus assembly protein PilW
MLKRQPSRARGFTLIEMMVGITVGLIVLWGLSSVYLNSARGSRTTTAANQLNQDLRAVMDIMVNDIRRAGYWEGASNTANPFTTPTTDIQMTSISASHDCILYSYDATHAGGTGNVVDTFGTTGFSDFFGFRLSAAGVVQTLDPTINLAATTVATPCATDADWQNLTDERAISVTALTFRTTGSKCISFVPATYDYADSATYTQWTTIGAAMIEAACSVTSTNRSPVPAAEPPASNSFVETRLVTITLTASSVTDPTLGSRTLTEQVLVRNNRLINP